MFSLKLVRDSYGCFTARCHLAPVITIEGGERVERATARTRRTLLINVGSSDSQAVRESVKSAIEYESAG